MRLVASRDIQEPDLAHIEAPLFACSKIRRLLPGNASPQQILGNPMTALCTQGLNRLRPHEELLREVEEGRCFLVIRSRPGPFQPPVRWQPAISSDGTGRWVADESLLGPGARFNLEQAITRIEREKHRARRPAAPAREKFRIEPINGNPWSGIAKRYANAATGGHAFPEHLTAAEEKGLGSRIRNLYGGNDTIQNQTDIAAYNDKPSALGVTHGQIFDAMETAATALSFLEGGLLFSRLAGAGKTAETVSPGLRNKTGIEARVTNDVDRAVAPGPVNFMGESDNFYKFSSLRVDIDPGGHFDVVAHGSPDVIEFMTAKGPMIVDHRTAARLIQEAPGYNGQPIRLLSCETGACDAGFAQNLANKLNVPVQAPTELVWAQNNGKIFVAPRLSLNPRSPEFYKPDLTNPGTFRTFSPGGNK